MMWSVSQKPRFNLMMVLAVLSLVLAGSITSRPVPSVLSVRSHPDPNLFVFPNGGRQLFPHYRLVALYGVPGTPVLGALGAQPESATLARVKRLAVEYQPLMGEHALPTLEIIATVASAYPEPDNSYSYAISQKTVANWVAAARSAGVYIVLDLQPGRTDFLAQAKRLQPLLEEPNVGLALDPEWRLKPNQVPLEQIGSVSISEVNSVAGWLANLTKEHHLPQKLLLLHQFRLDMLPQREALDTSHPELAYAVQMDGQGSQASKIDTWHTILAQSPQGVHFGWKNFYKKDSPVRSPKATMALSPQPWYVSYQ